jgi:hypothetical protein
MKCNPGWLDPQLGSSVVRASGIYSGGSGGAWVQIPVRSLFCHIMEMVMLQLHQLFTLTKLNLNLKPQLRFACQTEPKPIRKFSTPTCSPWQHPSSQCSPVIPECRPIYWHPPIAWEQLHPMHSVLEDSQPVKAFLLQNQFVKPRQRTRWTVCILIWVSVGESCNLAGAHIARHDNYMLFHRARDVSMIGGNRLQVEERWTLIAFKCQWWLEYLIMVRLICTVNKVCKLHLMKTWLSICIWL